MANEWTLQSVDTSKVGQPPSVVFRIVDEGQAMEADPPGFHIRTDIVGDHLSHVVITSTATGEVFADVFSVDIEIPSLGEEWNSSRSSMVGELAAALYWSLWRGVEVKRLRALESEQG
jgi:hypothetical protein